MKWPYENELGIKETVRFLKLISEIDEFFVVKTKIDKHKISEDFSEKNIPLCTLKDA